MDKLLLVDGSNLLFQMFYGMPARIVGKSGKLIHGTLGFVGALLKILKMTEPTHLIVLFDGECENERKAIDGDYKANRPDYSDMAEEETPFCQLPDIYAALDYLKIAHTETRTCETDDVIAAYALQNRANMQVVVSSFDSDFFPTRRSEHLRPALPRGEHPPLRRRVRAGEIRGEREPLRRLQIPRRGHRRQRKGGTHGRNEDGGEAFERV